MKLFKLKVKDSYDSDDNAIVRQEYVASETMQDIYEQLKWDIIKAEEIENFRVLK